MIKHLFFFLLTCGLASTLSANLQVTYRVGDQMAILDSSNGAILSSVTLTLTGQTIDGTDGLAADPVNAGALYVILRSNGVQILCSVDRATGACTEIGTLTDDVANMAFDSAGVLYAVTSDTAVAPETMFTVDLGTAAMTQFLALGNGDDGEAVAFNPDDGFMYHLSGHNPPIAFESIDLSLMVITPIANSLSGGWHFTAFHYDAGGVFFTANSNLQFGTLTTAGAAANLGPLNAEVSGMVMELPASPIIVNPASLNLGTTAPGVAGAEHTFDVSATGLSGDLLITAPAGVEVSLTTGSGFAQSVTIVPVGGDVALTTVFARISAAVPAGPIAGDIVLSSPNVADATVAVTGQVGVGGNAEMDVSRDGEPIANGGVDNLSHVRRGTTRVVTYTITNSGTDPLNITTPVQITELKKVSVVVVTEPANVVAPLDSTDLVLEVTPEQGAFAFKVSITNDDSDENPYEWGVVGTSSQRKKGAPDQCSADSGVGLSLLALMAAISAGGIALRLRRSR